MDDQTLAGIRECLIYLVAHKPPLPVILRNSNQFAVALIAAETCMTWIRQGEQLVLCEDTAYPKCYVEPVGGAAVTIRDDVGVTMTAYMASQFASDSERCCPA